MNPRVTVPMRTECASDLLDEGLDVLRACSIALATDSGLLEPDTIRLAMNQGIQKIELVREVLDKSTAL